MNPNICDFSKIWNVLKKCFRKDLKFRLVQQRGDAVFNGSKDGRDTERGVYKREYARGVGVGDDTVV